MDTTLWIAVPLLVLSLIPIGTISGDGLAQSAAFTRGTWSWNPNHLLMEPLGASWQHLFSVLGSARHGVDQLKVLSVLAGAVTLGLFRWGVAAALASTRWAANHATLWVLLGSGFSRLLVSDEVHMVQMPAVTLLAVATVQYMRRPGIDRAVALGAAAGLASLFFISNALLGPALVISLAAWSLAGLKRTRVFPLAAGAAAGAILVAGGGFLTAWLLVNPSISLLDWLTSYGGGETSARAASLYGATISAAGLTVSAARALYGSGSALVDVSPVVEIVRDALLPSPATALNVAAFVAGIVVMLAALARAVRDPHEPRHTAALVIAAAWIAATLGFGVFWNNSDDQFFFQLSIAFGALVAILPVRLDRPGGRMLALAALLALGWNALELSRLVLYPRQERIEGLEAALRGSGLVIFPGMDELNRLLAFIPAEDPGRWLSLMFIATRYKADEGLPLLQERIEAELQAGRRVDVVGVFDVPPARNPWKALRELGYPQPEVVRFLGRFPVGDVSRYSGPFSIRSIHPERGASPARPVILPPPSSRVAQP